MFATLDPTSRRLRFPREREVIITDTVGFIRDLPADLVTAFRATLEELDDASLLLHVVDASTADCERRIEAVRRVLRDIGIEARELLVFNQIDRMADGEGEAMAQRHDGGGGVRAPPDGPAGAAGAGGANALGGGPRPARPAGRSRGDRRAVSGNREATIPGPAAVARGPAAFDRRCICLTASFLEAALLRGPTGPIRSLVTPCQPGALQPAGALATTLGATRGFTAGC